MIRVTRNKVVFTMLLVFCVALMLLLSYVQINTSRYPIAIFTDGVNMEETPVVQLVDESLSFGKISYVTSEEEGIKLLKSNQVCFFIRLVKGEDADSTTAVIYYDRANPVANTITASMQDKKNEYTYKAITEFLTRYGIVLNENYFQALSFVPANNANITVKQVPFAIEVVCCVSIVLMLGIAYSLARDNETQVSKNIAYIPVGSNRYLISKILPYFVLGIIQIALMFLLGMWLFNIKFQTNLLICILLSSFGVLSILTLGLLFSLFKSQISSIFIGLLTVLVPVFVLIVVYVQACPIYIQILLYCVPTTPFAIFISAMIHNGVVLWQYIPIFIVQILVYYSIALFITKRRVKQ